MSKSDENKIVELNYDQMLFHEHARILYQEFFFSAEANKLKSFIADEKPILKKVVSKDVCDGVLDVVVVFYGRHRNSGIEGIRLGISILVQFRVFNESFLEKKKLPDWSFTTPVTIAAVIQTGNPALETITVSAQQLEQAKENLDFFLSFNSGLSGYCAISGKEAFGFNERTFSIITKRSVRNDGAGWSHLASEWRPFSSLSEYIDVQRNLMAELEMIQLTRFV